MSTARRVGFVVFGEVAIVALPLTGCLVRPGPVFAATRVGPLCFFTRKHIAGAGDICQEKRLILAEIDRRQNGAQNTLQLWSIAALGPPAALLILGLIGAWIVQGFRTGGGNGAASNKD